MVKKELLSRKLNALEENLQFLEKLKLYTLSEFLQSHEKYGSTERFLQLAIEILDDIGTHIIADENLGEASSYAEVARLLYEKEYISKQQSEFWISMVGFRNILVHGYTKLDRNIVYKVLQENLGDLKELGATLGKLL